jgi:SAM-dependent methyltransferase
MAVSQRRSRAGHDVARYYDSNTGRFLTLGGGRRSYSIHRPLWGPGVGSTDAAINYINVLLGDAIEASDPPAEFAALDLGCGVGGSMFALGQRFADARLIGVTISERQYGIACQLASRFGLAAHCRFHCGDFESIDLGIEVDIVFAVESMVHACSLTAFLDTAFRHLKTGGMLIIVDDFIVQPEPRSVTAERVLADFRRGWRLASLTSVPELVEKATAAGFAFKETRDLTPLIRLTRLRDRVIAAISPLLRHATAVPMLANFVGGAALTRGTRAGMLGYRWVCFRR